VTCHTQPCRPCEVIYILHYLPQGDESSPRGSWGICAPALPEVLTIPNAYITWLLLDHGSVKYERDPSTYHTLVRHFANKLHYSKSGPPRSSIRKHKISTPRYWKSKHAYYVVPLESWLHDKCEGSIYFFYTFGHFAHKLHHSKVYTIRRDIQHVEIPTWES
jgi:hypothetical protein